jgi:hypothetical protein
MRGRLVRLLLACGVAWAIAGLGAGAQAATRCPASFQVLHDDRVGTASIPAGTYQLRPNGLSCAQASALLTRFLDDFDGALPGGWSAAPSGRAFVNAVTGASFALQSAGGTPSRSRCPGTFTVQHDDRIGALRMRAGRYVIRVRRLSCPLAARQLAFFLFHDYAGTLPRGWRLNVASRRFTHGRSSFGVRFVSRHGTSGGGGLHPNLAITCPGTVVLAAGTTLGSLVLPAGRYYVNVFSDLSCSRAERRFERFAAAAALPAQWVVVPETGTFLRGNEGFQVEPAT